ncbi:hypothetical protein [Curtobacterium sp. MCBD17_040]|uniref:hypothetical protein n=1 Tax=Curtobacterium sp. MCBD17_040 TaxID=2175674 RepID=UPI0011B46AD2|nr:hypothetical protein [Curtobacterium sp. MCBD17_040]WIB65465.1 hypothetical protein DEI94_19015 [Curtobacterium sp. MCBD17_040]
MRDLAFDGAGVGSFARQLLSENAVDFAGFKLSEAGALGLQVNALSESFLAHSIATHRRQESAFAAAFADVKGFNATALTNSIAFDFAEFASLSARLSEPFSEGLKNPAGLLLAEINRQRGQFAWALAGSQEMSANFVAQAMRAQSATPLDAVAPLWDAVNAHRNVQDSLDDVLDALLQPGPLGIDYAAIEDRAERLAHSVGELDGREREALDAAVAPAAHVTHTASSTIRDQVDALGLGAFARHYGREVSIFLAFSVGLTYATLQAGAGDLQPGTFFEAAGYGSGVYKLVRARLR